MSCGEFKMSTSIATNQTFDPHIGFMSKGPRGHFKSEQKDKKLFVRILEYKQKEFMFALDKWQVFVMNANSLIKAQFLAEINEFRQKSDTLTQSDSYLQKREEDLNDLLLKGVTLLSSLSMAFRDVDPNGDAIGVQASNAHIVPIFHKEIKMMHLSSEEKLKSDYETLPELQPDTSYLKLLRSKIFDDLPKSAYNYKRSSHKNHTPLMMATYYDDVRLIKDLIRGGCILDTEAIVYILKNLETTPILKKYFKNIVQDPTLAHNIKWSHRSVLDICKQTCAADDVHFLNTLFKILDLEKSFSQTDKFHILYVAVKHDSLQCIMYLLGRGVEPVGLHVPSVQPIGNGQFGYSRDPIESILGTAIRLNHKDIVSFLLSNSSSLVSLALVNHPSIYVVKNETGKFSKTTNFLVARYPLEMAKDDEIKALLIKYGANRSVDCKSQRPLLTNPSTFEHLKKIFGAWESQEELVDYLMKNMDAIREQEKKNPIYLYRAISDGNIFLVQMLLNFEISHIEIPYVDSDGSVVSPMMHAINLNKTEMIELFTFFSVRNNTQDFVANAPRSELGDATKYHGRSQFLAKMPLQSVQSTSNKRILLENGASRFIANIK